MNFDPGMPSKSNPVLNVADEFPDICSMSPFELWQYMFGSNITHLALYESNLYANWDKNDQQFALDQVDLSRFFGNFAAIRLPLPTGGEGLLVKPARPWSENCILCSKPQPLPDHQKIHSFRGQPCLATGKQGCEDCPFV